MSKLVAFVKNLKRNEEGQDLLEYALLVALIALVAIAAVTAAGGAVERHLQRDRHGARAARRKRCDTVPGVAVRGTRQFLAPNHF